ncbi:MAG TPA: dihydrofolate reductase [Pyrinomonadaceae bacterium]|nr:dihydrofolate reductase [Pyrinomonadaceae bacterium]
MIIGIVAVDRQGAIGKDGKLPWHYSADMKHFKETTIGHACVMGRRTWLTLKKPLKERLNIVLSRQGEIEGVGDGQTERRRDGETGGQGDAETLRHGEAETSQYSVISLKDVGSVLSLAPYLRCDLFVIGGGQVYSAFLPYIDKWIVTEVPMTVEGADAFVPENYLEGFTRIETKKIGEDLIVSYYVRTTV